LQKAPVSRPRTSFTNGSTISYTLSTTGKHYFHVNIFDYNWNVTKKNTGKFIYPDINKIDNSYNAGYCDENVPPVVLNYVTW